jgi:hypothetical protein
MEQRVSIRDIFINWVARVVFTFTVLLWAFYLFAGEETREESKPPKSKGGEIVLDEIDIEAVIEKPNVTILPALGDAGEIGRVMEKRSFTKELNSLPTEEVLFPEHFDKLNDNWRIRSLLKRLNERH